MEYTIQILEIEVLRTESLIQNLKANMPKRQRDLENLINIQKEELLSKKKELEQAQEKLKDLNKNLKIIYKG